MRAEYPFSAVVGQDQLKLALLLSAVDPTIGGVLIKGERGTAKSTIARGLAALLPAKADGAAAPFIELPLGATEDRVVGSLDVTRALRDGHAQLRSGVLARANGGVLYVDEVNLLPDHLVDLLLDAAASGWVTVERDGVSAGEAARFVLVGTMNPEEGDLRPQFLDRFGLSVEVRGLDTQELRMAAVGKRLEFDADPGSVIATAREAEDVLRRAIVDARARLLQLPVTSAHLSMVAAICFEQMLDGIRGDLAIVKTARALAAWEKASEIGADHVRRAAAFALPHRMRRRPAQSTSPRKGSGSSPPVAGRYGPGVPAEAGSGGAGAAGISGGATAGAGDGAAAAVDGAAAWGVGAGAAAGGGARAAAGVGGGATAGVGGGAAGVGGVAAAAFVSVAGAGTAGGSGGGTQPRTASLVRPAPASPEPVGAINLVTDLIDRESSGRRGTGSVASRRAARATPYDQTGTLAINETLTAAAARGRRVGEGGIDLAPADLMQHGRSGPGRSHVLFLVDASASMATQRRLELAKSAVLSLLRSNYQHRDEVALMVFRGESADLVIPFTSSIEGVEQVLGDVPTGGRTPLARALIDAARMLRTRNPALLVVFTDGRANVSVSSADPWEESLAACKAVRDACAGAVVIDCEPGPIVLGRARQLAAALGAECVALSALEGNDLTVRILQRIEALQ
ncbi:MAG: VWA domain-containing protein [Steroidobacteraceae bacterium]